MPPLSTPAKFIEGLEMKDRNILPAVAITVAGNFPARREEDNSAIPVAVPLGCEKVPLLVLPAANSSLLLQLRSLQGPSDKGLLQSGPNYLQDGGIVANKGNVNIAPYIERKLSPSSEQKANHGHLFRQSGSCGEQVEVTDQANSSSKRPSRNPEGNEKLLQSSNSGNLGTFPKPPSTTHNVELVMEHLRQFELDSEQYMKWNGRRIKSPRPSKARTKEAKIYKSSQSFKVQSSREESGSFEELPTITLEEKNKSTTKEKTESNGEDGSNTENWIRPRGHKKSVSFNEIVTVFREVGFNGSF